MFALLALHILAATIWVGGMFFAYVCLRPAAASLLDPPERLQLWRQVFQRFFKWVWISVIVLLLSGHGMIAVFGGFGSIGVHVHIMLALGYLMFLIYGHLFFSPYKKLCSAVEEQRWPDAGEQLNKIRKIVGFNLILGLITIAVAAGGKFIF